jgi:two-component system, OmpR family, sensor histidine kinase SenX3
VDTILPVLGAISLAAGIVIAVMTRRRATRSVTEAEAMARAAERNLADIEVARDEGTVTWERAPFGVIALEGSGRIAFSNAAARRLLGARHGAAITELRIEALLATLRGPEEVAHDVVEIQVPKHQHIGITAVKVSGAGRITALVYLDDLTQRVRVDAMRRDFLANISHELKTPLGALSVLAETLEDESDPDARNRLTFRLRAESARMARLVEDIMDLSLAETGDFEHEPLIVQEVVKVAVHQVEPLAHERDVTLEMDLPGEELKLVGDARQLETAIANLVDNAIRYSSVEHRDTQGRVGVAVASDGSDVTITVRDNGVGIPSEHHDRIFERFYRVDRARSRETGGTGLGLAIVRHVAINHGGSVAVSSAPGAGATFTITLPAGSE